MTRTQTEALVLEPIAYPSLETISQLSAPRNQVPSSSSSDAANDDNDVTSLVARRARRLRKFLVTFLLSGVNFANSSGNGLVIIALPRMTRELNLPPTLAFWPASVSGLATASTLLLAGAVADVLGPKAVNLLGCITNGAFMIGCGFVQKGEDFVVLRALAGVGLAMHLSSSVSLVTKTIPQGRGRNISFACLGLSQPLGFSFGLVVGGTLVDTIGWRAGWYLYGAITLLLATMGFWVLPQTGVTSLHNAIHDMKTKVDWVGAGLASAFMAMLSYFLA